jgi:pantoate ligase / CMP/dCMP kinase
MRLFTTIAGLRCFLEAHRSGSASNPGDKSIAVFPVVPKSSGPKSSGPEPSGPESSDDDLCPPLARSNVGFVPTMGALHAGHLSLVQTARRDTQVVIVSIFVNPLQFGPTEDWDVYPRTLEADLALCEAAGVDAVFAPKPRELGIMGPGTALAMPLTQVMPPVALTTSLCGRSRPGHFQGVATIVAKLLSLVQPDRAYFGQKDAQQVAIIRALVADLNLPVEVVVCPIVREPSGLALSSRNQYLSETERQQAAGLYAALRSADVAFRSGVRVSAELIELVKAELTKIDPIAAEYIEVVHPNTMQSLEKIKETGLLALAARVGTTRLIDNILLTSRRPIVAIDGPAGAGKSTVARQLAQALGLLYLDTGAMYRALTWRVLQAGIDVNDEPAVAELLSQCDITLGGEPAAVHVAINGRDVTQEIRSLEVTANVSAIAAQAAVRQELVHQQRRYGQSGGLVMEGRDIGTFVFPDAELKIYLTASVQERARRRQQDLLAQGKEWVDLEILETLIADRDYKDSNRSLAPLRKAADAIEVQTDGLTIAQVIDQLANLYRDRTDGLDFVL